MKTNLDSQGFKTLETPSEEVLKSKPGLKKAFMVKMDSLNKGCQIKEGDEIYAYSGHNDYSSIQR
jgi:hypothetical protein